MVMMLRQCCCGCTLKTGTIIIGVLDILGGLLCLIGGIALAVAVAVGTKDTVDEEVKKAVTVVVIVYTVVAVIGAIELMVAICLIRGALKGIPVLLVPWMVCTIVYMILQSISYFFQALQYFALKEAAFGAIIIIVAVICILLQTYFLLVVYSLYREQKRTTPTNIV